MAVRFLVSIVLMAVVIAAFGVAKADRLPTEVELNAAYCLKFIRLFSIPFAEQARSNIMSAGALEQLDTAAKAKIETFTKDEVKKARDGETLLKLYLLSRMSDLDPVPIIAAMKRGELDATDFRESLAKCFAECPSPAPTDSTWGTTTKCGNPCVERDDLTQRVASCSKLTRPLAAPESGR